MTNDNEDTELSKRDGFGRTIGDSTKTAKFEEQSLVAYQQMFNRPSHERARRKRTH